MLFCRQHGIRQGYVTMFIAGFEEAEIVGTCEKLKDPKAPVWSRVYLENVEALGCGTIAADPNGGVLPHVHTTLGLKERSASGYTSHLLSAKVQFLVEMTSGGPACSPFVGPLRASWCVVACSCDGRCASDSITTAPGGGAWRCEERRCS